MKALQVLIWVLPAVLLAVILGCHKKTIVVHQEAPPAEVYVGEPSYVVIPEPPPRIIVEHRPPRPSHEHIWLDGYWHWRDHRYVWVPGCWVVPPHEHTVWVKPQYDKFEHNYKYTPGHWREEGRERSKEQK